MNICMYVCVCSITAKPKRGQRSCLSVLVAAAAAAVTAAVDVTVCVATIDAVDAEQKWGRERVRQRERESGRRVNEQ